YYKHNYDKLNDFKFNNGDYKDFREFLKTSGFEYKTETEKTLEKAYLISKTDDLQQEINKAYVELSKTIDIAKEGELSEKEDEISKLIIDELVKRYFYRDGLYNYQLENNEVIEEAVAVLKDPKKYTELLNP
ncbi:MAG: peptidase S41, partial [Leeuwenhoekiella sp.]